MHRWCIIIDYVIRFPFVCHSRFKISMEFQCVQPIRKHNSQHSTPTDTFAVSLCDCQFIVTISKKKCKIPIEQDCPQIAILLKRVNQFNPNHKANKCLDLKLSTMFQFIFGCQTCQYLLIYK